MTQIIEIQNDLVSLIERTVQYQIPMTDWLDKIEKRQPLFSPVLPVGTRAVYWDTTDLTNQKLIVLIEVQPQIINLDFQHEIKRISLPYTRFFFYCSTSDPTNRLAWHIGDYRVYFSKNEYQSPDDADMIPALLPNVYRDGRICFGSTGANMEQSIAQRLQQTVNEFFVSRFNRDIAIYRPNGWRGWNPWVRMTERDATGWMNWPDLDMSQTSHSVTSFDALAASTRGINVAAVRLAPVVAAEPIPEVPMGATFGRLNEWLNDLSDSQRDRLLQAMLRDRALNNERYATPATEEEDDIEVDGIFPIHDPAGNPPIPAPRRRAHAAVPADEPAFVLTTDTAEEVPF